jgi:hypothetical protein
VIPNEVRVLTEVTLHAEGERDEYLEIKTDEGWMFSGVKVRNTFVESVEGSDDLKLAYLLKPGALTRWWGGFGHAVHQIEVLVRDKDEHPRVLSDDLAYGDWLVVWEDSNDFQTLEEMKAAGDAYAAFIEREAEIVAKWIDTRPRVRPQYVYDHMSDEHSGNTAAWAWNLGCGKAKDQERAEVFRRFWNEKWAPDQDVPAGQTVNPAILHFGEKAD